MSLTCSFTLIVMILKSKKKLATPYRRLIFGMSCFDIFYSFTSMLSFLPIPAADDMWGAVGTRQTCSFQGFLVFLGATGCPMYNLSLCIFYLSIVVYRFKTRKFVRYIEPLLHIFPILYSFIIGIFLLMKGYFNAGADYSVCWIAPYPKECLTDPTVPCERGEKAMQYRWLFIAYPISFIFLVIIATMSVIVYRVHKQEKSVDCYRFKHSELRNSNCVQLSDSRSGDSKSFSSFRKSRCSSVMSGRKLSLMMNQSKKHREVMSQAFYYVLCYVVTWALPYTNNILDSQKMKVPFVLRLMARLINPGQGIWNILVYTRPHVIALRKAYPEYSWLKAFTIVVKSGGDNDGSIRRRQPCLKKSI